VTVNAVTGKTEMTGADALSWALDMLDLGGEIRGRYVRLQEWARALLVENAVPGRPVRVR